MMVRREEIDEKDQKVFVRKYSENILLQRRMVHTLERLGVLHKIRGVLIIFIGILAAMGCAMCLDHADITIVQRQEIVGLENKQELQVDHLEQAPLGTVYEIPKYPGKKSYMGDHLFGNATKQYQLQLKAVTDENGLRVVDGRYCIAVGTRFDTSIGQYIDLILENGVVIPCVVGDEKSDMHTDSTHTFSSNECCSEFIVHLENLDENAKRSGDISALQDSWKAPVKFIVVHDLFAL